MSPRRIESVFPASVASWATLLVVTSLASPVLTAAWSPRAAAAEGQNFAGRRWALLIGVDQYKRLTKLQYCGDDMRALGQRLVDSGFHKDRVVVLQDQAKGVDFQPLKLNIEEQIKLILGSATE